MKVVGSALLAAALLGAGCSDNDDGDGDTAAVAETYATNVYANYSDTLAKAQALDSAIDAFVAAPSQATLDAAKQAWLDAREPYLLTEAYRFYDGPIDNPDDGPEPAINAWPLDEAYIDYVVGMPNAGIINDTAAFPAITVDVIQEQNENGGEANISAGYHAIEFLLWGQDDEDPKLKTAGQRPFTDYVTSGGTAKNQARRGQYLKLVAEILVEDLEQVTSAWAPGEDNYAKTFLADPKDAVTKMLTGMGSMANAELSGERMIVAYKNRGQEDEHSCFSDTTNADLLGNFVGIQNVYLGKYGATDGPGLDDLVKAVDPALDAQMKSELDAAVAALNALQSVPFDFAIDAEDGTPERANVLTAIQAVRKTAPTILQIGQKLGVEFKLEEPSETL